MPVGLQNAEMRHPQMGTRRQDLTGCTNLEAVPDTAPGLAAQDAAEAPPASKTHAALTANAEAMLAIPMRTCMLVSVIGSSRRQLQTISFTQVEVGGGQVRGATVPGKVPQKIA